MKLMKVLLTLLTVLAAVVYGGILIRERFYTDKEPPVISFDSDTITVSVYDPEEALLSGVTAADAQDGDLSQSVMVRSISQLIGGSSAKVSYIVFDSADNMATASRMVVYSDYEAPRFELTEPLVYPTNSTITLQDRLFVRDAIDGDLSGSIRLVTENINIYQAGVYDLTVLVTNSMGDSATLELPVIIRDETSQDPVLTLTDYLIYLEQGASFDPEDYVDSVRETADAPASHDGRDVSIASAVDPQAAGTYRVTYSYENEDGRDTEAILTVVVQ